MLRSNIGLLPFVLPSIVALSSAQTGPQAALIPACVVRRDPFRVLDVIRMITDHEKKSCDPAAIASVNCTNEDQYCHCVRQDGILSNISACANAECETASRDIYVFTTLFGEVCQKFNISVPVLGSNSSGNGSNVTFAASPQPSAEPSTGSAGKAYGGGYMSWTLSGILCVTAFGVLL